MSITLMDLMDRKLLHGMPSKEERKYKQEETVLGQDGVYLSYKSDFFDVVYKIESFGQRTKEVLNKVKVPEVEQRLNIKEKIPSSVIHQMVAWYRHVTFKYRTEATMQVFYDISEGENDFPKELLDKYEGAVKREGKFVYVIPIQNVTGGFVSFDGGHFPENLNKELYSWALAHYEPILNIHSHNSMDAFWSGTDDDNELPLYNRLCLVIGRLDTDHPEYNFSWNFEGRRHHFEDKIDDFIEPVKMTTTVNGLGYHETKELGFDDALGLVDYDKVKFEELWDNQLRARGLHGLNRGKYVKVHNLDKREYLPSKEDEARIQKGLANGTIKNEDLDSIYAELGNQLHTSQATDLSSIDEFGGTDDGFGYDEDWKTDLMKVKKDLKSTPKAKKPIYTPSKEYKRGVVNNGQVKSTHFRKKGKNSDKKHGETFKKHKKAELRKSNTKAKDRLLKQTSFWDDFGY